MSKKKKTYHDTGVEILKEAQQQLQRWNGRGEKDLTG